METDIVIIGGGPAGLTAGIYSARYGLKTILIEKGLVGGTMNLATSIQNWPGVKNSSGAELMNSFKEHAIESGVEIKNNQVLEIKDGAQKTIVMQGEEIIAKAIIVAVGSRSKVLGVRGEKEFLNKGVHSCATCDGPMYKDKQVVIIGEDNRAVEEAIYLKSIAKKVMIITSKKELSAEKAKQENATGIEVLTETTVKEFKRSKFLEKVVLKDKEGKEFAIEAEGAFIYVGTEPNADFVDVKKDEFGRIIVNEKMETNKEGIFACGDCIKKELLQVVTSAGEGATAAFSASKFIRSKK